MYVKSSEKGSENLSQNNSAISNNINRENVFFIWEIVKKYATEKPYLNWNFQG